MTRILRSLHQLIALNLAFGAIYGLLGLAGTIAATTTEPDHARLLVIAAYVGVAGAAGVWLLLRPSEPKAIGATSLVLVLQLFWIRTGVFAFRLACGSYMFIGFSQGAADLRAGFGATYDLGGPSPDRSGAFAINVVAAAAALVLLWRSRPAPRLKPPR